MTMASAMAAMEGSKAAVKKNPRGCCRSTVPTGPSCMYPDLPAFTASWTFLASVGSACVMALAVPNRWVLFMSDWLGYLFQNVVAMVARAPWTNLFTTLVFAAEMIKRLATWRLARSCRLAWVKNMIGRQEGRGDLSVVLAHIIAGPPTITIARSPSDNHRIRKTACNHALRPALQTGPRCVQIKGPASCNC